MSRSPPPQGRERLIRFGPPAAALALTWAVVWVICAGGGYPFTPDNLSKWDATLYQQIAQRGYEFFPCAGQSNWGGQAWCGNTGWFPLYPWLTKLVALFVRSTPVAALLITAAAFYGVLWLIWNWFFEGKPTVEHGVLLALAAVFPGALYYVVPYPLPLYLLLILLCYRQLLNEQYLAAGLLGGLASLAYSSAPALVLTLAAYLLIAHRQWPLSRQLRPLLLTCGLTAAGYLLFLLFLQISVGHWDANLKVLGKYGVGVYDPLATVIQRTVAMFRGEYRAREEFQGFQSLLCTGLVLGLTVVTTRDTARDNNKPPTPLETLALTHGLTFWLFPLVLGSSVLPWRTEALLLPMIVLLKRLSRPLQVILLATCALLCGEITLQYFKNWLP